MAATVTQPFAEDCGRDVRSIMNSKAYQQIFPNVRFRKGSQAADRLQTEEGGLIAFVGRGGSITGRGADLMIIDDPLKNRAEADSEDLKSDVLGKGVSVGVDLGGSRIVKKKTN